MTDGTAGWFRDPSDPALARWHDGERWTEHTLVIADQAPGVEPPPPVTANPAPTATWDTTPAFSDPGVDPSPAPTGGRGPLPTWAKVVAPLVVIAIVGIAFLLTQGDDSGDSKTETNGVDVASLDEAVTAARRAGLTEEVSDARAAALIERICDAAETPSLSDDLGQQMGNLPATTASDLRKQIAALGEGAEARCPDALEKNSDLIDELSDTAAVAFSTTTTAPTVLPDGTAGTDAGVDGGTDGGAGTGGKTATTKKGGSGGTTATTARPTTTTTLRAGSLGSSCPSEGAVGYTSDGRQRVCTKASCSPGSTKLAWDLTARRCQSTSTTVTDSPPPIPTTATTSTVP
jgi:hypothetical protein